MLFLDVEEVAKSLGTMASNDTNSCIAYLCKHFFEHSRNSIIQLSTCILRTGGRLQYKYRGL